MSKLTQKKLDEKDALKEKNIRKRRKKGLGIFQIKPPCPKDIIDERQFHRLPRMKKI